MIQKFTMLKKVILFFVIVLSLPSISTAQKKQDRVAAITRCYTMERVKQYLQANPAAKALAQKASLYSGAVTNNHSNNFRPANVVDIINVPVIFHIVLPNPYLITDAVVQSQIDELNIDYAGLNADSTNAVAFFVPAGFSQHTPKIIKSIS